MTTAPALAIMYLSLYHLPCVCRTLVPEICVCRYIDVLTCVIYNCTGLLELLMSTMKIIDDLTMKTGLGECTETGYKPQIQPIETVEL